MTATIKNAAPMAILKGIQDLSTRQLPVEAEALPTHLPHVFLYAEKGALEPQLVVGSQLAAVFGSKTFEYRSAYTTHQTVLANLVNGEGNALMIQRVKPDDANGPATLRLCLDLLPTQVPVYQRNADGSYKRDANGVALLDGTSKIPGHIGKWVVVPVTTEAFGLATKKAGTQVDPDTSTQSELFPIFDFEVSSFGAWGNNCGVRLWAPTLLSGAPVDDDLVTDQKTALYRVQFVEREDSASLPLVKQSLYGEQYREFSLKEGAVNTKVDTEMFVDEVVISAYNDNDTYPKTLGSFGKLKAYHNFIDEVLEMIVIEEAGLGEIVDEDDKHLINLLTGVDYLGNNHHSLIIKGPLDGGLLFSENTTHYATGATDGTMSALAFDGLVGTICDNYDALEWPLLDDARYPQSVIYDSGFTLETKKKLLRPMGLRKDMHVVLSTQDLLSPVNTESQESSMAVALRTAARMYPESEIYGTPVCRATVVGHCGRLLNSNYKGILPLTLQIASVYARYCGASNGVWKQGYGPDLSPNNRVTMFTDVNCTYKKAPQRARDWAAGLVWVQQYDMKSLFFPAVQTVYDDDTSILNSHTNMTIAVELEKVANRVWRDLTGIDSLTQEQFIERSNRLIEERTRNRFDGRVVIEADTYVTEADEARGYSWSCNINMYGNNMKSVGSFTIVSRRTEDLE